MSSHERRIAARKAYAIPVRFNVITEQYAMASVAGAASAPARASGKILTTIPLPQQGEIVNLSERGIRVQVQAKPQRRRKRGNIFYAADGVDGARAGGRALQCAGGARGNEPGHARNDGGGRGH